jgi:hypothetical protein
MTDGVERIVASVRERLRLQGERQPVALTA